MAMSGGGEKALVAFNRPGQQGAFSVEAWHAGGASLPGLGGPVPVHYGTLALDPSGLVAATGDMAGVIRVWRFPDGERHLLVGHEGPVGRLAISPDGRWVASTGDDNTLRLWPMPDLSRPSLHALPAAVLRARLRALTNVRAVRDAGAASGWALALDPFPGWRDAPDMVRRVESASPTVCPAGFHTHLPCKSQREPMLGTSTPAASPLPPASSRILRERAAFSMGWGRSQHICLQEGPGGGARPALRPARLAGGLVHAPAARVR